MITLPRCPVKFNCHGDPSGHARKYPKEKSQPDCISQTKYNRIRHRSRKQAKRPVLATQQIVSEVKRTEHVEARCRDADACQQVMVDGMYEMHAMIVERKS